MKIYYKTRTDIYYDLCDRNSKITTSTFEEMSTSHLAKELNKKTKKNHGEI